MLRHAARCGSWVAQGSALRVSQPTGHPRAQGGRCWLLQGDAVTRLGKPCGGARRVGGARQYPHRRKVATRPEPQSRRFRSAWHHSGPAPGSGALVRCASYARRKGWPVDLVLGNGEQLPFADDSFDLVFHIGGINFFDDKAAALAEMARVAKPGTHVLVADETERGVPAQSGGFGLPVTVVGVGREASDAGIRDGCWSFWSYGRRPGREAAAR
nr:class I SAM-dependent methyltransferase [Propionibacterium sp.]